MAGPKPIDVTLVSQRDGGDEWRLTLLNAADINRDTVVRFECRGGCLSGEGDETYEAKAGDIFGSKFEGRANAVLNAAGHRIQAFLDSSSAGEALYLDGLSRGRIKFSESIKSMSAGVDVTPQYSDSDFLLLAEAAFTVRAGDSKDDEDGIHMAILEELGNIYDRSQKPDPNGATARFICHLLGTAGQDRAPVIREKAQSVHVTRCASGLEERFARFQDQLKGNVEYQSEEDAIKAAGDLGRYIYCAGLHREAISLYDRLIRDIEETVPVVDQPEALAAVALSISWSGLVNKAVSVYQRAIDKAAAVVDMGFSEIFGAVSWIADTLSSAWLPGRSVEIYNRLIDVCLQIKGTQDRVWALTRVAKSIGRPDLKKGVESLYDKIIPELDRDKIAIATTLEVRRDYITLLGEVAKAAGISGLYDKAVSLFNRAIDMSEAIGDEYVRVYYALVGVAWSIRESELGAKAEGLLDRLVGLSDKIENPVFVSTVLRATALAAAKNGLPQKADELFKKAVSAAERIEDRGEKIRVLCDTAQMMGDAGFKDESYRLFERMIPEAVRLGESTLESHFSQMAASINDAELGERAATLYEKMIEATVGIGDENILAGALIAITAFIGEAKLPDQVAAPLFERLITASERVRSPENRAELSSTLAFYLNEVGLKERAVELFGISIDMAEKITNETKRVVAFSEIASKIGNAGLEGRGAALYDRLIASVEGITDPEHRGYPASQLVSSLSRSGLGADAVPRIIRVIDIVEKIENERERIATIEKMIVAIGESDLKENAAPVFVRLIEVAEKFPEEKRIEIIESAADTAGKAGMGWAGVAVYKKLIESTKGLGEANRTRVLVAISHSAREAELGEAVYTVFDKLIEALEDIEQEAYRVDIIGGLLFDIARVDWIDSRTLTVYVKIVRIAEKFENWSNLESVLKGVATALSESGREDYDGAVTHIYEVLIEVSKKIYATVRVDTCDTIAHAISKSAIRGGPADLYTKLIGSTEDMPPDIMIEAQAKIASHEAKAGLQEEAVALFNSLITMATQIAEVGLRKRALNAIDSAIKEAGLSDRIKVPEGT